MVFVGSAYTYLQDGCRMSLHAPPRHDGLRRSRPHDAVVSRACRGRARGSLPAQAGVPDLQRLHDWSAARARLPAATRSIRFTSRTRTRRSSKKRRRRPGHEPAASDRTSGPGRSSRSDRLLALCRRRLRALRPAALHPYFVQELGWTRQQVRASGNAHSKIFVALAFGFLAGRLVDRFGPRRLLLGGS